MASLHLDETIPLRGETRARLLFTHGCAPRVAVRGGAPDGALAALRFERPRPKVTAAPGEVRVAFAGLFASLLQGLPRPGDVALCAQVAWDVEIARGVARATLDLAGLDVRSVRVRGGASDLDVALGAPRGAVPVVVHGGASGIRVRRPAGVPVRVDVLGGASHVALDRQELDAVGGPLRLASRGAEDAVDRYDVEVRGGASSLRVLEAPA